ncbi:MAG: hypothetical protein IJS66_04350 [Bacteroidales bacterium]|nr:hypothetical protein [Bacteroidales bacterium]
MRRLPHIVFLLLAGCLLLSCNKESSGGPSGRRISLSFEISLDTRAGAASDETDSKVKSLDILIFSYSDGSLQLHERREADGVTVSLVPDERIIYYVVANAPEDLFTTVTNVSGLKTLLSTLGDNPTDALMMVGHGEEAFSEPGTVTTEVMRLASKVEIQGITPVFKDLSYISPLSVSLDAVYLINVCGGCDFSFEPAAGADDLWYNKLLADSESLPGTVKDHIYKVVGKPVENSSEISDRFVFYTYPNPTDNDVNSSVEPLWSVRNTRLVLEFTIGEKKNYYPIDIPAMKSNTVYRITAIKLLAEGSSAPDIPVVRYPLYFKLSVAPWGEEDYSTPLE